MKPPWLTLGGWLFAAIPLAFTLGMTACPVPPGPGPVTPPDASDAAPPPPPQSITCAKACRHLEELGCAGAGACSSVCARIIAPSFRDCLMAAPSCGAVDRCDTPK